VSHTPCDSIWVLTGLKRSKNLEKLLTLTIASGALVNKLDDTNTAAIASVTAANAIAPKVATLVDGSLNIAQTADDLITIVYSEALGTTNQALYAQDLVLTDKDNNTLVAGVDYTTTVNGSNLLVTLEASYANYSGPISVGSKSTTTYIVDGDTLANKAQVFAAKSVTVAGDLTAPSVTVTSTSTTINASTFNVDGTTEAGSTVNVYNDVNNNGAIDIGDLVVATGTATAGGTYSIATLLTQDAANNFVVTATDADGNVSAPVDVPTITEDSTAPVAPDAAKLVIADNISTAVDTLTGLAGAVEGSSTVNVYSDAALTNFVGTGTANADGSFSAINLTDATAGTITYYVVSTDVAGNVSVSTSKAYTANQ
jgi:hypothetical protein